MTRTIDQMIASEVLCCMSSLVATLAQGYRFNIIDRAQFPGASMVELFEQAFELAAPIDDWEEAAIQAGWALKHYGETVKWMNPTDDDGSRYIDKPSALRHLCEDHNLEPVATEVYEHWAVTDWFADKLEAAGEKVDRDFAGLNVWGRTTTGQSMTMDGVVQRIYAQTHTGLEG